MSRAVVELDVWWQRSVGVAAIWAESVEIVISMGGDGFQPFFPLALVEEAEKILVIVGDADAVFFRLNGGKRLCNAVQKAFRKFLVGRFLGDVVHKNDCIKNGPWGMACSSGIGMPPLVTDMDIVLLNQECQA